MLYIYLNTDSRYYVSKQSSVYRVTELRYRVRDLDLQINFPREGKQNRSLWVYGGNGMRLKWEGREKRGIRGNTRREKVKIKGICGVVWNPNTI